MSHTIHGTNGIFAYIWLVDFYDGKMVYFRTFIININKPNLGKYTVRPMDGMGFRF